MRESPLFWFVVALVTRVLAAASQANWGHPDEWYQTVEHAHAIAFGVGTWTEATELHLRNLFWPTILSGVLQISEALVPGDVGVRVFSVRAFTGLLNAWTVFHLVMLFRGTQISRSAQTLALSLWVLVDFWIADSVRPSQEHLSLLSMMWSLSYLVQGKSLRAGVFASLAGAMRYPSGLFSAAILLVGLIGWPLRSRAVEAGSRTKLLVGVLFGILLGGIPDWIHYGRPYESFYFYFQYNVLTGLGAKNYGVQSLDEYLRFFQGHFGRMLILPLSLWLLSGIPLGLWRALRHQAVWLIPMVAYLVGHAWTPHKEPRFMAPVLPLLVFTAVLGVWIPQWKNLLVKRAVLLLIFTGPLLLGLRTLWGETFRNSGVYEEVSHHLETIADRGERVCAVVAPQRPLVAKLPGPRNSRELPVPATAFFPVRPHSLLTPSDKQLQERPLIWIEHPPTDCLSGGADTTKLLLLLPRSHPSWKEDQFCERLSSGIYRILPASLHGWIDEQGWGGASWWKCPPVVLTLFERVETRKILAWEGYPRWESLPPLRVSGEELLQRSRALLPDGIQDATIGDY